VIDTDGLITETPGLTLVALERWIAHDWVRPQGTQGAWRFAAIDIARVHLIIELSTELAIDEEALPVILLLLDQIYLMRRQILDLGDALERRALGQGWFDIAR
jgi:chaperone modulatory protein CbpM